MENGPMDRLLEQLQNTWRGVTSGFLSPPPAAVAPSGAPAASSSEPLPDAVESSASPSRPAPVLAPPAEPENDSIEARLSRARRSSSRQSGRWEDLTLEAPAEVAPAPSAEASEMPMAEAPEISLAESSLAEESLLSEVNVGLERKMTANGLTKEDTGRMVQRQSWLKPARQSNRFKNLWFHPNGRPRGVIDFVVSILVMWSVYSVPVLIAFDVHLNSGELFW